VVAVAAVGDGRYGVVNEGNFGIRLLKLKVGESMDWD
jgi:hypothetical protein